MKPRNREGNQCTFVNGIGRTDAPPQSSARPPTPTPLPSDAGLYPYLFGWTPSRCRNQREIEAKGCSPAASPNVRFPPTDERRSKRPWISTVFRKTDGVQQKRCGTRPAQERGSGGPPRWGFVCPQPAKPSDP